MNLTTKQLKQIIREELNEIKGIDEPASGGLGKWVFPNQNMYSDEAQDADEENTQLETKLLKYLKDHIARDKPLPNDIAKKLRQLAKDSAYSEIFKMAEKGTAYRGMEVPASFIEERFGGLPEKPKWYRSPINWFLGRASKKTKGTFTTKTDPRRKKWKKAGMWLEHAKSKSSSWTTSFSTAQSFADAFNEDFVSIVLVADMGRSTNYWYDIRPLYKFFDFAEGFKREQEVIAIGDVDVDEIIWLYRGG